MPEEFCFVLLIRKLCQTSQTSNINDNDRNICVGHCNRLSSDKMAFCKIVIVSFTVVRA